MEKHDSQVLILKSIKIINDDKSSKKKFHIHLNYISLNKVICSSSVVIMYCNNFFYGTPYINYKHYWKTANFVDTLLYFAYPCFYLCIGATLLDFNNKYGIKEYYKRRIKKIIIPFFSWNIILYFYKVYIIKNFKKKSLSFKYIWTLIFEFKLNFIFKSFFSFIKIYLIIPIFAYVEKSYKVTIYSYFILVLFICQ